MLHTAITDGAVEIVLPYPTLLSALHYNVGFIGMRMGPHYLRTVRKHTMAERSAKIASYPVLKVFRRYASFRVALGFAQPPRQFARIPEQRFQPPAKGSIRLGLMVLRESIRTIYHEVEIHESAAFQRYSAA